MRPSTFCLCSTVPPESFCVDDEQSIQTLLSYPLRKEGYHVTSALDGNEALQRFDEGRFDLVVLDLMLPKLDGVEVCRRSSASRRARVPLIDHAC